MRLPYFPVLYDTRLPLFVYGTLRTGAHNWQRLLHGRTSREQPAVALQHVLHHVEYAFIADGDGCVYGDVIEIQPELYLAVMRDVDALEEFDPATGDGWYVRVIREVLVDQQPVLAWTYHASPRILAQFTPENRIHSGDWLAFQAQKP